MKRMTMPEPPDELSRPYGGLLVEEIDYSCESSDDSSFVFAEVSPCPSTEPTASAGDPADVTPSTPARVTDPLAEAVPAPASTAETCTETAAAPTPDGSGGADQAAGVVAVEPGEPPSLVDRWRAGDESAAWELFNTYAERLLALARRRISQRLASRVDPEDVVQSVFRTFFGRLKDGQFTFADQDDLGKLLVRITIHKTLQQVAYHKAAKRDPSLEECQGESSQDRLVELFAQDPTPEEEVAFVDQLEQFLTRLRPQERQILELRLQGYSNEEIAEQLGIYDRKIRRVIERIRGLAQEQSWWQS